MNPGRLLRNRDARMAPTIVIYIADCEMGGTDIAGRRVRPVLTNSITELVEWEREMSR
jgi:hypothetical protein